jgi:hypothetical protein
MRLTNVEFPNTLATGNVPRVALVNFHAPLPGANVVIVDQDSYAIFTLMCQQVLKQAKVV